MGFKTLCLGMLCAYFLSHIYTPVPDNIEESWKVMALDAIAKTCTIMGICLENTGIMRYEEFISMIFRMDYTQPLSDEYITVIDTDFADIPVRLYLPKRKSETLRRAIIYMHGGAFCFGSCNDVSLCNPTQVLVIQGPPNYPNNIQEIFNSHLARLLDEQTAFDFLNRWTANKLDAVVVGVDYRLAPQHHFPAQFEDGITAVKFFLQDKILSKYGVDPRRVCISGDSSGGALAAAVIQQVQNDPEIKNKIKIQALLYPGLQMIDTYLPSHRENEHGIVLTRDITIKLVSLYFTKDEALPQAMRKNQHMPLESRHLFKFVNWSTLLPEKFRKGHVYTEPILGRSTHSFPALMDNRASPLLANDSQLQNLPLTYILTCQYDILRDDGLMYVSRLRNVGVQVDHEHIEDGIHGALSYMTAPFYLHVGLRIKDMYTTWLDKNL